MLCACFGRKREDSHQSDSCASPNTSSAQRKRDSGPEVIATSLPKMTVSPLRSIDDSHSPLGGHKLHRFSGKIQPSLFRHWFDAHPLLHESAIMTGLKALPNALGDERIDARLRKFDLHPNLWSPQREELAHQLFVHEGTHILESGMSPCPIIKCFDVIKGAASGLRSRLK